MTTGQYEAAEALVYDPVASNRSMTREALRALGFRTMEFAGSLDALRSALAVRSPDLLLCEVGGCETQVCELIQSIRQSKLANNPFVVAILTSWRRDGTIVGQAINSGADDLLARPFSAARLGERIKVHIERRKGFVVTSHYIGPDRRQDASRAGVQCVEVPNSLKMKTALGTALAAQEEIATAVSEGKRLIDAEKLRRDAMQLYVQWRILQQRNPAGRDYGATAAHVGALAAEIGRRAAGPQAAAALEWCETLNETAHTIGASLAAGPGDALPDLSAVVQEMGEAVMALGQIFAPGDIDTSRHVELDGKLAHVDLSSRPTVRPAPPQAIPPTGNRRATAA